MSIETISILFFFTLIGILLIKDRKKVEFKYGIVIRRWEKGKYVIDKFVKKYKKHIEKIGNISIIVSIIVSIIGVSFLFYLTFKLKPAFGIVLPSVGGFKYPEPIISIPFWYWIGSIFIIVASHETMHAIFARLEKIRIKSYGILLFLVFPIGAFVDPDMKMIKKLKTVKKLRIFSAGSFGNFLVFLIIIFIFFISIKLTENVIESVGIRFDVLANTPAERVGLKGIIYKINNKTIKSRVHLINFLNTTKPGEKIIIYTTEKKFILTLAENPDKKDVGFIGITNIKEVYKFKVFNGYVPESLINSLLVWYKFLFWTSFLSLGVGIANLLPIKPLDGGYIFEEIFEKIFGNKGKIIMNFVSGITIFLLFLNLFAIPFIKI